MAIRWDELSIPEQAARWFYVLEQEGDVEQAAFNAWLKESPRHVEEFLLATATYRAFDGFESNQRLDIDALLREAVMNVVPLDPASERVTGSREAAPAAQHRKSAWGIAAGLLITVIALAWLAVSPGKQDYSTEIGEQRVFDLADGTVVYLNTHSRVAVQYSDSARVVRLLAGEAMFKVAPDSKRPFVTYTDTAAIQAIGTLFNVHRRARETRISVIEGAVRIATDADNVLKAGEEASVAPDGRITRRAAADPTQVSAWRQRRLVFRGEPLIEVAEEFNRYNRAPKIRVAGETAAKRELMGIFDADDPESLVLFLEDAKDLTVQRQGKEIVVRMAGG